jgi:hypothetical protein
MKEVSIMAAQLMAASARTAHQGEARTLIARRPR